MQNSSPKKTKQPLNNNYTKFQEYFESSNTSCKMLLKGLFQTKGKGGGKVF